MNPLRLERHQLDLVCSILERHLPGVEVWAFGSRVHGENLKPFSDLDLALITREPLAPLAWAELKDAFSESELPFKVDLVDWATTSDKFRALIQACHVVICQP